MIKKPERFINNSFGRIDMTELEYDVLKAEVMGSLDGDEIAEMIFKYDLNEYSYIKLTPLWQHMRACLCRLGVQRAYGIDLTWSERDVDVLHRVAIDLHNSLTSAKTGFKTIVFCLVN